MERRIKNELIRRWAYTHYGDIDIQGIEDYADLHFELKENRRFNHYALGSLCFQKYCTKVNIELIEDMRILILFYKD
ncbi:MAG: hypothetical protein JJT76_06440 [Clostridiaceae bacterium]|nr:hypothetical protein [Clostridiaceae bacterium]